VIAPRAHRVRFAQGLGVAAFAGLALLVVLSDAACGPVPLPDGERKVLLRELSTNIVLPAYQELDARAEVLRLAVRGLAEAPSLETLGAAQQAWRDARAPWKESEAFAFGPAMELRLAVAIDQWPVEAQRIEDELAGSAVFTDSYVNSLGANRKGFHSIEYLLFSAAGNAAALTSLSGPERAPTRRREYLVALADNLRRKATALRDAWSSEGGYFTRFTEPGRAESVFPTVKGALDTFVNESVFLAELIADAKLGKPLGNGSGGTPLPALEESGPSDNSGADMLGNLRSIRSIYLGTRDGTRGMGLTALVAKKSPATDAAVRRALEEAMRRVEAIPRPYRTSLFEHRAEIEAAYAAVKELKVLLATEVVALLGATLKFNDNDGD
jgi:uncharacterized protein